MDEADGVGVGVTELLGLGSGTGDVLGVGVGVGVAVLLGVGVGVCVAVTLGRIGDAVGVVEAPLAWALGTTASITGLIHAAGSHWL